MYKEATKIVSLDSRRWKILFRYIKFLSGYCLFITSDFIYFIQHPRKIKKWDKFRFFNFPCKSLNNKNMSMVNVTIYGGWFASCFCYVCMDSIIEFSNSSCKTSSMIYSGTDSAWMGKLSTKFKYQTAVF